MLHVDPKDVGASVKAAIRAGYRLIDCAWDYGNEKEVGDAIREMIAEGVVTRKDLFITSKVGTLYHPSRSLSIRVFLQLPPQIE